MTRHLRSAVTCDQCGCTETVVADDARADRLARSLGWGRRRQLVTRRYVDLCPAHKGATS